MGKANNQTEIITEIWDIIRQHRWRLIVPMFVIASAILVTSLFLPRKYAAEAVFERRTDMVLAEMLSRGSGVSHKFTEPTQSIRNEIAGSTAMDAMVEALRTDEEAREVLESLKMTFENLRDEVDRKVHVNLDVTSTDLDRVRVSYSTVDPRLACLVTNTLINNYIKSVDARMQDRLLQTSSFFRSEVQRNQAAIEALENKKLKFEIENSNLLPDLPSGGLQIELESLQERLVEASRIRDMAEAQMKALEVQLKRTPRETPVYVKARNPELAMLERKLTDAKALLEEYVQKHKMTMRHPDVVDLRRQIASLQHQMTKLPTEVVVETQVSENPKHAELELELTRAQTEHASYTDKVEQLEAQIKQLNDNASQVFPIRAAYRQITREVQQAQRQLGFWEDNLRRVELALAAETGDKGIQLEFIKQAEPDYRPVSPNLLQILVAAIGLGLLGGGASVFLAHRSDDSFHYAQQLPDTFELPLVGTVSQIVSARQRFGMRLRSMVVYPLAGALMVIVLAVFTGMLYLNLKRPEVFREIKANPTKAVETIPQVSIAPPAPTEQD